MLLCEEENMDRKPSLIDLIKSLFSTGKPATKSSKHQNFVEPPEYKDYFSHNIELVTDTATMTLFDPSAVPFETKGSLEWWIMDSHKLDEVSRGKMAIISLSNDGVYRARVTNQDLTPEEKDYAKFVTPDLGLEIVSGKVFIGTGEEIPGGESFDLPLNKLTRHGHGYIILPNGHFTLRIFGINYDELDGIPTDEAQHLKQTLPDIVIQLIPGKAGGTKLKEEPSLFNGSGKYLFKSTTRAARKRLQPGFILRGIVAKKRDYPPRNLILKQHIFPLGGIEWPEDYTMQIDEKSWERLKWKDRVDLKVTSVDKKNKVIEASVEKVDSSKVESSWYNSELYLDDPEPERRKQLLDEQWEKITTGGGLY